MRGKSPPSGERPILFVPLGRSDLRPFGLDARMRAYRVASMAGMEPGTEDSLRETGDRAIVIQDVGHVVSPGWLDYVLAHPGHLIVHEGRPVLAHSRRPAERMEAQRLFAAEGHERAEVFTVIDTADIDLVAVDQRHRPFIATLDESADLGEIERALYAAATPRVADAVTLGMLRLPAFRIARAAARAGLTANRLTAIAALLALLAFLAFWFAAFGLGILLAIAFLLADSMDGKLAKVTGTSNALGRRLDALLGLVHPPLWYVGWMNGVEAGERALEPVYAGLLLATIIAAFFMLHAMEAFLERRYGFPLSLWRRFDSRFRLISARRNVNILILGISLVLMRPEWGIQWVAFWSLTTVIVYAARLATAKNRALRREWPTTWLEGEER